MSPNKRQSSKSVAASGDQPANTAQSLMHSQQTISPARHASKDQSTRNTIYDFYIKKKKLALTNYNPPKRVRFSDDETHSGFVRCTTR